MNQVSSLSTMVRWCGTITTRNSSRLRLSRLLPLPGTSCITCCVLQGIHIILIEIIRLHFVAHQCILRDGKFKRDLFEVIFIERFPDDIGDLLFGKTLDNGGSEELQFDLVVWEKHIRFPGKVDDRFVDHEFSAASLVALLILSSSCCSLTSLALFNHRN